MNASPAYQPPQSRPAAAPETKTLLIFLAITFGLTWGLAAVAILFADQVTAIFGEIGLTNPLVILAIYSPGIAGVGLVLSRYGLKGLGSYFQRLTVWKAPLKWWLFLVLGIPAVVYTGAAIKGTFSDPLPFASWQQALPALALALFLGPIEEFGSARAGPAALAAQICPTVGRLDPGRHLGAVAPAHFPDQRHAADRLGRRALLPGHYCHLGHPGTPVQCLARQPADRHLVPLPDDESDLAGCPTL